MNSFHRIAAIGMVLSLSLATAGCASHAAVTAQNERAAIETQVHALLTAYQADDQNAALKLVDSGQFSVYGSDISEFVQTTAGLRQMMSDDFKLWHSAKFGPVKDLDIRIGHDLATAFFNIPFSVGGRPAVMVRMTTVWRKVNGVWLLTQSSNTVPTTHSSARELLHR
ncbi:MAG TPA: nuclear transport factor 2 family protein [Gammaproteobacteria bacterium]|nr:nuclear transport factor 2 family protein [Gammaproteobacteria bacterium]